MTAIGSPSSGSSNLKIRPTGVTTLRYDPQDYRMGPLAVFACQLAVVVSFVWGLGAILDLELPPSLGVLPLLMVAPALVLTPRTTLMQFPVSISVLLTLGLTFGSYFWSVDQVATFYGLIALFPSTLTLVLVAGLVTEREMFTGLLWGIRVMVMVTIVGLALFPEARTHISTDIYIPDYPGWHGLFTHKNEMTPVLCFSIPTVLIYDRNRFTRWLTLAAIMGLLAGSSSATGLTASAFAVLVWFWLRVYSGEADVRSRSLYIGATVLGALAVVAAVVASIATITSAYGKDTSFSGRTDIWETVFVFIAERPFTGYGFNALFWRFPVGQETTLFWRMVGFPANHAHNGPLDYILQLGLIGFSAFALLWVSTWWSAWSKLDKRRSLAIWTLTFMSSNLLMALSENVLFGAWVGMFAVAKMLMARRDAFLDLPPRRFLSERLKT